jgi:hypothetical protein
MAKQTHPQHRLPFAIIESKGHFYISKQCCYDNDKPEFSCGGLDWKIIYCDNNLVVRSTTGVVMKGDRNEMLKRIKNKGYVSL